MKKAIKIHHIKDILGARHKGYIIVLADCGYGEKAKLGDELPKFELDEWDKITCKRCLKYRKGSRPQPNWKKLSIEEVEKMFFEAAKTKNYDVIGRQVGESLMRLLKKGEIIAWLKKEGDNFDHISWQARRGEEIEESRNSPRS